ncbi:MAG: hypothetical protein ACT4O0_16260 [Pseudonocardia sp.]|jgi:hypothetical protein
MKIGPLSVSPAAPPPGPQSTATGPGHVPAEHGCPPPPAIVAPTPAPSSDVLDADAPTGGRIRVDLATLLGLADHPATTAGRAPVPRVAAQGLVAAQHRGAAWRFVVTDAVGHLVLAGPIRLRPGPEAPAHARRRGGLVEIHVSVRLLEQLLADPARSGAWSGVVADIAAQYTHRDQLNACLARHPAARGARRVRASRGPGTGRLEWITPFGLRYPMASRPSPAPRSYWPPGHRPAGGAGRST